jgi:cytoskeletal protein RodZ
MFKNSPSEMPENKNFKKTIVVTIASVIIICGVFVFAFWQLNKPSDSNNRSSTADNESSSIESSVNSSEKSSSSEDQSQESSSEVIISQPASSATPQRSNPAPQQPVPAPQDDGWERVQPGQAPNPDAAEG